MKRVFPSIKVSIIIAVLDSHKIVRKQIKYFRRLSLPDDVEIILVDDGSNPPLIFPDHGIKNLTICATLNFKPWTQPCARNLGARIALGEHLMMTDIDHIFSKEAILAVRDFDGDKMRFPQAFAVLNAGGGLVQDPEILFQHGLSKEYYQVKGLVAGHHVNTFAIRKSVYMDLDGYHPKYCEMGIHALHEDSKFYHNYLKGMASGKYKEMKMGPDVYVYPGMAKCKSIAEIDPLNLFHKLSRDE
jgi:glycosyltransferase involved in cell wall biosynthesis